MIHPSYVDLMNIVNQDAKEGEPPIVNSRYSIVMAAAKRARQLVDGDTPMVDDTEGEKPLTIAVRELEQGKLKILPRDEEEIEQMEERDIREARALEIELGEGEAVAAAEELLDDSDGSEADSRDDHDENLDTADGFGSSDTEE